MSSKKGIVSLPSATEVHHEWMRYIKEPVQQVDPGGLLPIPMVPVMPPRTDAPSLPSAGGRPKSISISSVGYFGLKAIVVSYICTQIINEILLYVYFTRDLRVVDYVTFFVQIWLGFSAGLIRRDAHKGQLWIPLLGPLYLIYRLQQPFRMLVVCGGASLVFFRLAITEPDFNGAWSVYMSVGQYFGFCFVYLCVALYAYSEVVLVTEQALSTPVVLVSPLLGIFALFTSAVTKIRQWARE